MKKSLAGFLAVLAVLFPTVWAWAEGSPVVVTHRLTGYSKADKTVTLEYAVQVQNMGNDSLGALTLSFVSHPPSIGSKNTVTVEKLGPKGVANSHVKVVAPLFLDRDYFYKKPLFWAGKYTAANGKVVEFPVTSQPGGAK